MYKTELCGVSRCSLSPTSENRCDYHEHSEKNNANSDINIKKIIRKRKINAHTHKKISRDLSGLKKEIKGVFCGFAAGFISFHQ